MNVGHVASLARYPVKSMAGESLSVATFDSRGVVGDRLWAVYTSDGGIGSGKTTRRFRRVDGLLDIPAVLRDGTPAVNVGSTWLAVDQERTASLLSQTLGTDVTLRRETDVAHHDESPVHLITTASVNALERLLGYHVDLTRFRSNVVLAVDGDDFTEERWRGLDLALGEVVLRIGEDMPRCVMVGASQRDLQRDPGILKTLAAQHGMNFGVQATVVRGGLARVGDSATLL